MDVLRAKRASAPVWGGELLSGFRVEFNFQG